MNLRASSLSPVSEPAVHRSFWLFGAAVVMFIATRFYILFVLQPAYSDIAIPYFRYAVRAYDGHRVPYQDKLRIEYPPVAWWAIYLPRWIVGNPITAADNSNATFLRYRLVFRQLMFLADLLCFCLLWLIARKRCARLRGWALLVYVVTTALLGHLLYDRLDLGLTLLFLVWAYCWVSSLDKSRAAMVWAAAAYAAIGLGISYKLIPIICVPFLLLSEWFSPGKWMRIAVGAAALALGAGGPVALQYARSGPGVFDFLTYHSERGIQVESIYSTVVLTAGPLLGQRVAIGHSHGAFETTGSIAPVMLKVASLMLWGFLSGLGLLALVRWSWPGLTQFAQKHWGKSWPALVRNQPDARYESYCFACFVVVGAVIFSKVLSPQYFVWALPLMILLGLEVFANRRLAAWGMFALLVAIVGMTTWLFPYYYARTGASLGLIPQNLEDPQYPSHPLSVAVLAIRNFAYLGAVMWLGLLLWRRLNETKTDAQQVARSEELLAEPVAT